MSTLTYGNIPMGYLSLPKNKKSGPMEINSTGQTVNLPHHPGVDYAAEYKKQTGGDLETGEYVTQ